MATTESRLILTAEDRTRQAFDSLQKRFNETQRVLNTLRTLTAGAFSVAGMVAFINKVAEAERQQNRLTAVINAQGHAAGFTRQQLDSMADALAAATEFDDDAFIQAQAEIIKFGNVYDDVFRRALKASADLASFQGTDLLSATQTVARALQSPAQSIKQFEQQLGRLDPTQKKVVQQFVEQNRVIDAQNKLLDILETKIGGTAELMNTGYLGSIKNVTEKWDDFLESLGRSEAVATGVVTSLNAITEALRFLDDAVKGPTDSEIQERLVQRLQRDLGTLKQQRDAWFGALPGDIFPRFLNPAETEKRIKAVEDMLRWAQADLEAMRQLELNQLFGDSGLATRPPPPSFGGAIPFVSTKQVAIPAPVSPAGANVLGIDAGFFNEQFRQAAGLTADDRANLLGIGPEFFAAAEKAQAFAAEDLRLIDERRIAQEQLATSVGGYLKFVQLETDLMGGTAREKQKALDIFALEAMGLERGTEEWLRYVAIVDKARDGQQKLNQSFAFGAQRAFDDYLDTVHHVANSSEKLFSDAFKGMEDALIEFVKTGTLSFSDLADQIISDLLRIAIQASITAPLARIFGSLSFGLPAGTVDVPPAAVGFQHGGSFRVGGTGGPDSVYQGLWLTPGERLTVETPAQQHMRGGVTVNVINQAGAAVEAQQAGPPRFDGEQWVVDVLLKRLSRDARAREQTRRMLSAPR